MFVLFGVGVGGGVKGGWGGECGCVYVCGEGVLCEG